jgi:hypothetical protein
LAKEAAEIGNRIWTKRTKENPSEFA